MTSLAFTFGLLLPFTPFALSRYWIGSVSLLLTPQTFGTGSTHAHRHVLVQVTLTTNHSEINRNAVTISGMLNRFIDGTAIVDILFTFVAESHLVILGSTQRLPAPVTDVA